MKKFLLLLGIWIIGQCVYAQKYVMDITQKDGNVIRYNASDVERLIWEKHEGIELGLSVKWATCNIGANRPEELGDYFAWGETAKKDYYDWSKYRFAYLDKAIGLYKMNKYYHSYGYGDKKYDLELEDDVVHSRWGSNWRMPTKAEQEELLNKCSWEWTEQNGINGCKVTGPNGNYIFLPAGGYRKNRDLNGVNINGFYWSRSGATGTGSVAHT